MPHIPDAAGNLMPAQMIRIQHAGHDRVLEAFEDTGASGHLMMKKSVAESFGIHGKEPIGVQGIGNAVVGMVATVACVGLHNEWINNVPCIVLADNVWHFPLPVVIGYRLLKKQE